MGVTSRRRTAAPDVCQHPEQHHRGDDDRHRCPPPRSMVHRVQRMPLDPVGAGQRGVARGAFTVAVPRPGVIEDQRGFGIGKLIGSSHRNRRNRRGRPRRHRRTQIPLGTGPAVEPGAYVRVSEDLGRAGDIHRLLAGPLRQMLERAQGRVVVPDRVQVIAPGSPNERGHKGHHGDQHDYPNDNPHLDHSTRMGSQSGSEAQFGPS